MQRSRGGLALLAAATVLVVAVGVEAVPAHAADPVTPTFSTASPYALPFDRPSLAELHASPRKAFAHYIPSLPLSLDNLPGDSDYYATNYLNPDGEGGAHQAYGGFIRDRPLPRPVRDDTDWQLADFEDEVRQADSIGLDGFSVDLLVGPGSTNTRLLQTPVLLEQAAQAVDPDFKIMLMPDMNGGLRFLDVAPFADYIAQLAASPAAYRLADGRLVLAPFKAEARPADWWQAVMTQLSTVYGIQVALLGVFIDERPYVSSFAPISYGMSNWGAANPAGNQTDLDNATSQRAAAVHATGDVWMQPISVQTERPRDHYYEESQNTTNLRNTWKIAIGSGAELVQLVTWNDYAEGSEFAPSVDDGWSYLDISAYYLAWWKTGRAPPITRDTIYLTHRPQPVAALPTYPETSLMALGGNTPARDTAEALTFLTAPGTVTVRVGAQAYTCPAQAGVDTCTVPLGPGQVSATVGRAGRTTAAVTSPYVVTSSPYVQDLHYYASTSSPVSITDGTAPTAPGSLSASADTTTVALSWDAATDDVGVNHYEVHRSRVADFRPTATTRRALPTGTTYTDTPPAGTWYYKIVAVDDAGNISLPSPQATATVPGAPTVVTLTPTADVYANQTAAATNNGTGTTLMSRGGTTQGATSYLRFVIPAAPVNTQLAAAALSFRTTTDPSAGSTGSHTVRIGNNSWAETSLTWNNKPPTAGPILGSIGGATAVDTPYQVPLDAVALRSFVGTTSTIAILSSSTDNLVLWSRENGTTSARPQLVLTYQQVASDTDGPTPPTAGSATVSGTSISLSWTASTDETGVASYDVHRSRSPFFTPSEATKRATVTTTAYTDATPGQGTWYYRIIAKDPWGQPSVPSDPFSATLPDTVSPSAPGTPSAVLLGQAVSLSWVDSTDNVDVAGYRVYRGSVAGASVAQMTLLGTVQVPSFVDDLVVPGSWWYRVVAVDAAGNASVASAGTSLVMSDDSAPSQVTGLEGTVDDQTVSLSWDASTDNIGVTGYDVYRSRTDGFSPTPATLLDTITTTSRVEQPGGGTWFYRVVAHDAAGNTSVASDQIRVILADETNPTKPGTPTGTPVGPDADVTWASSSDDVGVVAYKVYRSNRSDFAPDASTFVGTTDDGSPAFTDVNVGPGTWYYVVVAFDAVGNDSTLSDVGQVFVPDIDAPSQVTGLHSTVDHQAVSVGWDPATDNVAVTGYDVYRSKTDGFIPVPATRIGTVATTTMTDHPGGGTWYYQVLAHDAAGNPSPEADETSVTVADETGPSQPGQPVGTVVGHDVSLTWTASTDDVGVAGYKVYRSNTSTFPLDGTTYVGHTDDATPEFNDANLDTGTWYYVVVGFDAVPNDGTPSEVGPVSVPDTDPPAQVTGLGATVDHQTVSLNWDAATDNVGVAGYELYRSTTANAPLTASTEIDAGSGTSTTDQPGPGSWYYCIIAVDDAGNPSTSSDPTSALIADETPPSQPGQPMATPTGQSLSLTWTASTDDVGVAGYRVYRSATSAFTPDSTTYIGDSDGDATAFTDTSPGFGIWHYAVIALDAAGNQSAASDDGVGSVSDTDAPSPVAGLVATADHQIVSLSWGASTDNVGVTSYDVYRSPVDGFTPAPPTQITSVAAATTTDQPGPGTWYYRVIADDAAGNSSVASTQTSVVVPDEADPSQPGAPVAAVFGHDVSLTWTAATDNVGVTGYRVYRATTSGFTPDGSSLVTTTSGATPAFTDVNPGAGTWYYRVVALDAAGHNGLPSDEGKATVADLDAPSQVTGLVATPSHQTVSLSWSASTDNVAVADYDVYRSSTSGFTASPSSRIATVTTTSTSDQPGAGTWYYRVIAHDTAANPSIVSVQVSAVVPDETVPGKPGVPSATLNGTDVSLTWGAATDNIAVTAYRVYRSATNGFTPGSTTLIGSSAGNTPSYTDANPAAGTWYYRVIAVDAAGNSSVASDQATITVASAAQPTVMTINPTADTFASAAAPTTNYGSSTSMQSGGSSGASMFLRFVLPAAPTGQTLTSAVLKLTLTTDANAGSVSSHTVGIAGDGWTESTLNWNNKPAMTGASLGTISGATTSNTTYSTVLVPSALGSLLGTQQTLGITSTGGDGLFVTSSNSTNIAARPQLVLTFTPVTADITPPTTPGTPTATVSGTTVSLNWTASTDNVAVTGYQVHRSATSGFTPSTTTNVKTVSGTTASDTPGAGIWYYRIVAVDGAGSASPPSGQVAATVATTGTAVVVTVSPSADTFANSSAPTTNYGTNASLLSRGTAGAASYLRFVVPKAPTGKTLTRAVLRLHTSTDSTAGSGDKHTIKVAVDSWTETALTWNNRPAINGALLGTISGATAVNTQYDTVLTTSAVLPLLGTTVSFGITSTGSDSLYVWSRNFGTAASRPQLILTFG